MSKTKLSSENRELALTVCRGSYQRSIVLGTQGLSGADLKGKARQYGAVYKRSREALLARLDAAGVRYHVEGGTSRTGPSHVVLD